MSREMGKKEAKGGRRRRRPKRVNIERRRNGFEWDLGVLLNHFLNQFGPGPGPRPIRFFYPNLIFKAIIDFNIKNFIKL